MDILRFATAGSVDDGKSTLIGRLLHDSKAIFEDQLAAVERTSRDRGEEAPNLALLTDGLRAEREQGITIDVAYRYFATPRRKFIIADTPGHIQYTRNMVTGASTADLAIILVDARNGLTEQSRRHAFLATLLRVPHLVLAVNKMDLVGYDQQVFEQICDEFAKFAAKLEVQDLTFIPISALRGDNVVERSSAMPWFEGPSLLHHLEHVHIASDRNLIDVRFPVQYVIRPHAASDPELHDYRGYGGQVAGGVLKPGDEVLHLPSGFTTRIKDIELAGTPVREAFPPMSVTLLLDDDVDISRGDLICRPNNRPRTAQDIEGMVCWMSADRPLGARSRLIAKHTTRTVKAIVTDLYYRIDVNSLHRDEGITQLGLNEIGRVRLRLTQPVFADQYSRNRLTGGMILIDEATHTTVGTLMITEALLDGAIGSGMRGDPEGTIPPYPGACPVAKGAIVSGARDSREDTPSYLRWGNRGGEWVAQYFGGDPPHGRLYGMTRADLDKRPTEVAAMFDALAGRYDLMNDILSMGQVRLWRRRVQHILRAAPGDRVLDLAAGTGTSSVTLAAAGADVVACDFSFGMLAAGQARLARSGAHREGTGEPSRPDPARQSPPPARPIRWRKPSGAHRGVRGVVPPDGKGRVAFVAGDALRLPFADGAFDAVTISFGLRNVAGTRDALAEMRRVTRVGGRLVVCEFSRITVAPVDMIYRRYLTGVLPAVARRAARNPEAYEYLAESINDWPAQRELADVITAAGWSAVKWRDLTLGVVAIHVARNL